MRPGRIGALFGPRSAVALAEAVPPLVDHDALRSLLGRRAREEALERSREDVFRDRPRVFLREEPMSTWIVMLDAVDERLFRAVVGRRSASLDGVMRGVTGVADPRVALPFAVALALGALPPLLEAGRIALGTLVVSHLLVQILKRSVSRPRPRLPVGIESLIRTPDCFSFPSGHAAAGLAVWLPVGLALPGALGAVALGIGLLVGLSRCYLGIHYPGDVAAGWLLALLSMIPFARPELLTESLAWATALRG